MDPIKALHANEYYVQPGGEDTAFLAEVNLLRDHGHPVVEYVKNNRNITSMNPGLVALETLWSWDAYREIKRLLQQEQPQIAHFHNTFPLMSSAVYAACRAEKIPVVQSLDNPRWICPSANFYRDGRLCQDCLGKTPPWPSVIHACYHHSFLQTAVVASMLTLQRVMRTWQSEVDFYLVATEFYKRKFIEAGLPGEKIIVKPHFIYPDPGVRTEENPGAYALFIARLEPEKGIPTLLQAWKSLRDIPLVVRGDGRIEKDIHQYISDNNLTNSIQLIGRLSTEELIQKIKGARFLVWPSEGYYETFGYVAVGSFSCGIPVISSRVVVLDQVVTDKVTGLHFEPGDSADLAQKIRWAWEHPHEMAQMGRNARREYEEKYTDDRNYELLSDVYRRALALDPSAVR